MVVVCSRPPSRCALCHDGGDLDVECVCGSFVHVECRDELGGCPTLGCKHIRNPFNSWIHQQAWLMRERERQQIADDRQLDRWPGEFFRFWYPIMFLVILSWCAVTIFSLAGWLLQ